MPRQLPVKAATATAGGQPRQRSEAVEQHPSNNAGAAKRNRRMANGNVRQLLFHGASSRKICEALERIRRAQPLVYA